VVLIEYLQTKALRCRALAATDETERSRTLLRIAEALEAERAALEAHPTMAVQEFGSGNHEIGRSLGK
jgi:hypothetical protein